jgi:hypothetical protein
MDGGAPSNHQIASGPRANTGCTPDSFRTPMNPTTNTMRHTSNFWQPTSESHPIPPGSRAQPTPDLRIHVATPSAEGMAASPLVLTLGLARCQLPYWQRCWPFTMARAPMTIRAMMTTVAVAKTRASNSPKNGTGSSQNAGEVTTERFGLSGMHWHTHTCIHTYIHTDTQTYIHIHAYTHTHVHTHTYAYIPAYIHRQIHTYIHTYINTYIHTYIRACTYTHVNTQTHKHPTHKGTHV